MIPIVWDLNLRGGLVLAPELGPNIRALAAQNGRPYDEAAFLAGFEHGDGKAPNDPRAVRNTFEVLAYAGLAYRDHENVFRLSPLGVCIMTFGGAIGGHVYLNVANRSLAASVLVRSVAQMPAVQAVWRLWRLVDDVLTYEELNRAIPHIDTLDGVALAAERILSARSAADPRIIGPRAYRDADYGTPKESDQRKAMWPQFLLSSAGGLMLEQGMGGPERRLERWALRLVDSAIRNHGALRPPSTSAAYVLEMSRRAASPRCDRP